MKRVLLLAVFATTFLFSYAQPLTGNKTIPGDYLTIQTAIDSLNAKGVGVGGVTFQIAAGQVFNLTANAYALKITTTGTAANPIVFEKSGPGPNPLLNITGGISDSDAGVWLNGADYITFDGIDIKNAGSSPNNYIEYGFYLCGSATNGCSNNTFKNLTIRMAANYTSSIGIYSLSKATASSGKNSRNIFQNVIIKNSIRGVYFVGMTGFEDVANQIQDVLVDSSGVANYTAHSIVMGYQDSAIVTNTVVSHVICQTMYGISLNNSKNFIITNDTVRDVSNLASGTVYCVYFPFSAGNNLIKGNVIYKISSNGGGINPIFRQMGTSTNHITENLIYNITSTYVGGQVFGILARDGSATDYIYRNTVHNLTSSGNLGAISTLLTTAAPNVEYIYNNFVYDLKGLSTGSTYMIAGYFFHGGSIKLYYNTCFFGYTSTSPSNTSAALYVNPANAATLDARNNILVNTTNVATGLRAVAFWWAGTSYTNLATTCNNNLFYAGTPGTKNLLFYNGTNSDQTLAAFKTRVSPRETVSVTEMPPFISTVMPYNLHVNPGMSTQAESGGQQITTPPITTDIDNEIRWGNAGYIGNGTAPDIGADEFSVIITDCGITSVISPHDTICFGLNPMVVVLKNFGPQPLTSARIDWKVNSQIQSQYSWNGHLSVNGQDTVVIGGYPFHQDTLYTLQVWSSLPNYGADPVTSNDTLAKIGVFVKPPPTLALTSSVFSICQGDTAIITGTLTGTPPWSLVISDGVAQQTITGITLGTISVPLFPLISTSYSVLSISDGGGCPNTTPVVFQVAIHSAPPASITPSGTVACCAGDSIILMGTIGLNFTYQWLKDGALIPNATNYVYAARQSGAYSVVVISPIGCSATSVPVSVIVHPSPAVFLGNDTNLLPGANIMLDAGAGFNNYNWSTGATSKTIIVDTVGYGMGIQTIWVEVNDNNYCTGFDTIKINFTKNPGIEEAFSDANVRILPNPTDGKFELHLEGFPLGNITVQLFGPDGKLTYVKDFILRYQMERVPVDPSQISDGLYLLKITMDQGTLTRKVVVRK